MKITVLGAGLVGGPMARDLAADKKFDVHVADISKNALAKLETFDGITTMQADLSDAKQLSAVISNADIVLNAVPGFMGFATMKTIIELQKDVVDIAFYPENPFDLDEPAKQNSVTAIVDCGVAPGMSNLLAAHAAQQLDKTETILIYVGGLPEIRQWPYEYKAVFSPVDVIEEYTRPARYVENGYEVIRPALSDAELIDFPGIGTLEAFNSDGLRTLAETMKVPNMKEKTLRYPGHIEKMAVLRETGFFEKEAIEINGVSIRPLDFTAKLLFPKWQLQPGEADITVMQIIVEGTKNDQSIRHTFDLLDRYDAETGVHSMARTTGYTATMAVRLLVEGLYKKKGISPPEFIARDQACVNFMLRGLEQRGINYKAGRTVR